MLFASRVKKSENTAYLTIFRGAQKCENKLCCKNNNDDDEDDDDDDDKNKNKNKNKNHNNNNNSNNNKRKKNKHKNATKRCVVRWLQAAV